MSDDGIIKIDPDYASIIDEYITEALEQIYFLERSVLAASSSIDYLNIKRIAHNIKGSAGSFGINKVSLLFHELENSIKEMESENVLNFSDSQIDRFLSYLDFSKQILQRIADRNYDISDILININKKLYRRADDRHFNINNDYQPKVEINDIQKNDGNISPIKEERKKTAVDEKKHTDNSKKQNILLIEKSNLVRKMIVTKLINLPYNIIFCDSIEDSIKMIIQYQPKVIIANNIEQYFNGGGLCVFLKYSFLKDNFTSIIIATANGQVEGIEHCDYVIKKDSSLYNNIYNIVSQLNKHGSESYN